MLKRGPHRGAVTWPRCGPPSPLCRVQGPPAQPHLFTRPCSQVLATSDGLRLTHRVAQKGGVTRLEQPQGLQQRALAVDWVNASVSVGGYTPVEETPYAQCPLPGPCEAACVHVRSWAWGALNVARGSGARPATHGGTWRCRVQGRSSRGRKVVPGDHVGTVLLSPQLWAPQVGSPGAPRGPVSPGNMARNANWAAWNSR